MDKCVNHRQIVLKQSSVADKSRKGDLMEVGKAGVIDDTKSI